MRSGDAEDAMEIRAMHCALRSSRCEGDRVKQFMKNFDLKVTAW
jgi:hypothetical protein